MFPKMNPKQMAQMMRQMGISSDEIPAEKVVIHKKDGSKLEITSPSVMAMAMGGQTTYQISGEAKESGGEPTDSTESQEPLDNSSAQSDSLEDDVKLVMEQAKVSRETAAAALKRANGNIASAIVDARGE
ncbi:MAG: nascent polypeptide-associated complex protein [Candidatus Micrarchaeota archaeon]